MKVLFISRKYPPDVGGMQQQNFGVVTNVRAEKYLLKFSGSQINLFWFLPYSLLAGTFLVWCKKIKVVHLGDGLLAPLGCLIKLFSGAKISVTVHGLDITYNDLLYQLIIPMCLSKLDKIICVSNQTIEECVARGISRQKCVFIPNAIVPGKLAIKGSKKSSLKIVENRFKTKLTNKKIMINVGRLVKRKGIFRFLAEVFESLIDKYPELVFFIIGTGPEEQRIKKLVMEKDLKQVKMTGYISDELLM